MSRCCNIGKPQIAAQLFWSAVPKFFQIGSIAIHFLLRVVADSMKKQRALWCILLGLSCDKTHWASQSIKGELQRNKRHHHNLPLYGEMTTPNSSFEVCSSSWETLFFTTDHDIILRIVTISFLGFCVPTQQSLFSCNLEQAKLQYKAAEAKLSSK